MFIIKWVIFFLFFCGTVHAQICDSVHIIATTPDEQFIDHGNGTVSDLKTGLVWKKCLEGTAGNNCDGTFKYFNWQDALEQVGVNNTINFAGYSDWRLPNIKELLTLVEDQCVGPAINLNIFPGTPSWEVWSSTPSTATIYHAWFVQFSSGYSGMHFREKNTFMVRLVRDGQ